MNCMSDICISCEEKCTAFGNLSLCHNCKIVYYTQNTTNRKGKEFGIVENENGVPNKHIA